MINHKRYQIKYLRLFKIFIKKQFCMIMHKKLKKVRTEKKRIIKRKKKLRCVKVLFESQRLFSDFKVFLRLWEHCVQGQTALCLRNLGLLFLQKFQLSRRLVRHPLISHTFKIKTKIKKMSEEIVNPINLIRFHLGLDFSVKIILSIFSDFLR